MSELDTLHNQQHEAASASEIPDDALDAELVVQDPSRDINIPLEPPPGGVVYPVLWGLNPNKKDGGAYFKQSDKSGQWSLIVSLLGKVQGMEGTDFENYFVSDTINSFLRKGTTAIHHFMNCVGQPMAANTNLRSMQSIVKEVLGQEPIGHVLLEWRASYQESPDKWKQIASRMTDFPKNEDGTYQPWIEIPDNGEGEAVKIYAQAYVAAHVLPSAIGSAS